MVDEQRIGGESETDRREPRRIERCARELLARDVERADHGDDRPAPQGMRTERLDKGGDDEERDGGDGGTDEVWPAPGARCAKADDEQDERDRRDGRRVMSQQRGDDRGGEQGKCRSASHGTE